MFKKQSELIHLLTDKQIVQQLYFTQLLLLIISSILVFFLFDQPAEFLQLWSLNDRSIFVIGGGLALVVIFLDFFIMKVAPKSWIDDGGINEKIFKNRSIPHIIFLTLLISFSEEILFRGIIQTNFGIWVASFLFAVLHLRYLSKWLLFILVVTISFLLGIIYSYTGNLFVPVFSHFMIDLVFAITIRMQFLKRGEIKPNE
ncbi:CPBP family intramembrane glutamic endopeptidase [Metabacillus arenae]|uniref:CPBP family intramembrane metalloprotease n=1 Tax=Metabacillus arenae TaxID=2771434 RepID=A0A926RVC4_9BACI|nr:CPBP family intramembrane glutamic endopeptidase [Metabacillus arenae]MBD1378646.1 CPBP family intramembrane metalloprotease [Metabacillus arenae]